MADADSEKRLILAAQAGSSRAFEIVYERHRTAVERTCRRYLRDVHEVEEAVQETFTRAFRALPRFNGGFLVRPWLTTIARNVCWDTGRRKSRAIPSISLSAVALDIVGPPDVDPFLDPDGLVAEVLSRMRPTHVAALELASVHGMTHAEIAAILRKTPRQVKSLMFRARRAFEQEWASVDEAERLQTI